MIKIMCDFCEKKEADRKYKVKRRFLRGAFDTTSYKELDICDDCYIRLFVKKVGAK